MSEETIPLSFTAVDNLTKAVENMTAMLERMGAAQEDTTKATEEATDATKKQGEEVKKTQSAWDVLTRTYKDASDLTGELKDKYDRFREGLETAFYVVELGKTGLELLGGAYEKITGTIEEANSAWEEQAKKSGKSASSLGLISKSADDFTKSQRALYAELGKVIERSGAFQVAYKATSDLLKNATAFVKDNAAEWSKWGNRIGVEVAEKLIAFGVLIEENASGIARFALIFKGTTAFIAGTVDVLELWGRGLLQSIYTPIIETSKALYEFTGALAVMIGDTSPKLAQALRLSSSAFETLNKYSSSFAIENVGKVNEGVNSLIANSLELEDSFKAAFGSADAITVQETYFVRLGKRIKEAGTEYKKLFQESQGRGVSTGSGEREATNEQKRLEERLDLYNRILEKGREAASLTGDLVAFNREYYASRNLALKSLEAEAKALEVVVTRQWDNNEAQAISLETQQRMIELQAELAEIQDPIVRAETEKVRLAQIQIEEAMKLRDLEQQRFDLQTEAISQIGDYVSEAFGNVSSVIDGISESTQRMVDGFAKAAPQVTNLANSFRAYNKQGATAEQQQEAINAGIAAGAGVLSNVTASFIEDKKKQAAIEALINAAAAAASYATGNVPAGIAYTAAAVTYGAAAAFSGGGGGGGGGASIAGGGIAASSPSLPNAAEERRANAEAIAEAISSQRENQPIQINLSFDNALIAADSPQAARIISDMVIPEIRNILP